MFESFDFTSQKEEECEECLAKAYLVDAIIEGQQKRLCNKCIVANNAIVLKGPKHIEMDSISRPSVRDAIIRASGMIPKPVQPTYREAKLEDLRARYEETKKKKAEEQIQRQRELALIWPGQKEKVEVLDEKEFVNYIEKIPRDSPSSTQTTQTTIATHADKGTGHLDFSIEAAKKTRIRDLLEKMKRVDEELDKKADEKTQANIEERIREKQAQKEEREEQVREASAEFKVTGTESEEKV